MTTLGFYRRNLPPNLISFESPEGIQRFTESLLNHHMECYFPIASHFHTQSEPAYCGLGTLVNILNSLSIDPGRKWKGVWRWFSEELLDCCKPLELIAKEGLTLREVACLGRCNGADVEVVYAEESSVDVFREQVIKVCTEQGLRLAVSYHRGVLSQTGTGHFSPIAGYHEGSDSVLVMDVARFKYPPYWVSTQLLFESMNTIDSDTGKSRGYLVFKNKPEQCLMCHMNLPVCDSCGNTLVVERMNQLTKFCNSVEELLLGIHELFNEEKNLTFF
eukprot:TRINITY_DN6411_c0_g1_i2.p1 TRINITY_DN6411_c0_g1~~TRINITY_DN6411_c0_g1_i2.p1  ORF type:complete len:275 (+),score=32.17 TRINITY_DN6411_c0_g1_i2:126-950(+)